MFDRPRASATGETGSDAGLCWIEVARGAPYFVTSDGRDWTPIGQNDSVSWDGLSGLYRRRDPASARRYLERLADHGVTTLRLMLEYAEGPDFLLEDPIGSFRPEMVQLWDDLFDLFEELGLRVLLTPFDTFWTWLRFADHPYSRARGGPLDHPARALLCAETLAAIKARLAFATRRWGGSGALFAWDLWNEIHPGQARESAAPFPAFIQELSDHLRQLEIGIHGRAHPQTVSLFGPEMKWRPQVPFADTILRHPALDFANLHIYEEGTIDDPANTVDPAVAMGRLVAENLVETPERRPFFDSEHGPIHSFKDKRITLPEPFDDEYHRHVQWAHLAAGGAGGGMRWPNRHPHLLTPGMLAAQRAMTKFLPLIAWQRFDRRNVSAAVSCRDARGQTVEEQVVARFAAASSDQAIAYLLRRDIIGADGRLARGAPPLSLAITVPELAPGRYRATLFDTERGAIIGSAETVSEDECGTTVAVAVATDLVIAITRK
jgi:mannan endo-1,4-beta-mannosidase